MTINFDKALGIHPKALALRERRSEVLASNLANADTPGYKARDLEFSAVLKGTAPRQVTMDRTHIAHFESVPQLLGASLMYRNPHQASLDGNTVEEQIEQTKYSENAVQYQASLEFVSNKFSGLMTALKGQ